MEYQELVTNSQAIETTYQITPEIYFGFQRISSDFNPLHTDDAFALKKGFPAKVMYGNILNAFVSHLVGMALPTRDVMIQTQDIQYRKPVFLYDTIRLNATIKKKSASVESIIYKLEFYRVSDDEQELVATGHVQIGLLHDKIQ